MKKVCVAIVIILCLITLYLINRNEESNILYSWKMEALEDNELLDILKKYHIKELYQDFSSEYLAGSDSNFLKKMKEKKVKVYQLTGDPSWALDENAKSMKREIDKVVTYNQNNDNKLAGIVFDVEPYLHNKDNFDFPLYVKAMKEAYQYAKTKNVYMVLTIPVWFETINAELLEEVIKEACDEVSLMNYNIKYTKENMETELEYAKKYQKKINTIYEVYSDEEEYFKTYEEIDQDYEKIKEYYNYNALRKAYHHYEKMKENIG